MSNLINIALDLKFKKLTETMRVPTKAHPTDACFDLYADIPDGICVIAQHTSEKIPTGFATNIPHGFWGAIFARSGLATKQGLRPANCVAVIDEPYTGEWLVPIHNDSDVERVISHGDRIAQFTLLPYYNINLIEVDNLLKTDRGDDGFGSSGN